VGSLTGNCSPPGADTKIIRPSPFLLFNDKIIKITCMNETEELLSRGVEEVIDKAHLEAALKGKKKLRGKLGIDPTSPNLHIGHAVPLLKLREFQNLGHTAVLIIGDYTAMIG